MTPVHVLYHANCPDGMTAAWVAAQHFTRPKLYPVNYGEPMPEIPAGDEVLVLDFSYPRAELEDLAGRCKLRVLDHHKTAEEDLVGLPFAIFDMERSGAGLTWDVLFPGQRRPKLVDYVEDRDLWRFKLPKSREAAMYVRLTPTNNFKKWTALYEDFADRFDHVAQVGSYLLEFQEIQVAAMVSKERVTFVELGGHKVPCANATVFFSEVGEALCELYPGAPFAAYWFRRGDVEQWGLRSRGAFDCSAVAKLYGGGGHPGAAGFTRPAVIDHRLGGTL